MGTCRCQATDRATRSAATRCQPAIPPIQGLGRERAELNTRLSPLAASFFAWHRAARALGYCGWHSLRRPGAESDCARERRVAWRSGL